MKKIFTLCAAAMAAIAVNAQETVVSYDQGTMTGTFTPNGTCALDYTSKINANSQAVTVMTFPNSIKTATAEDGSVSATENFVKVTPAEGGFQAGDVVTFQPFTQMSTEQYTGNSKYANIVVYAGSDTSIAQVYTTGASAEDKSAVTDGHEEAGEVKAHTFSLEADAEALFLGRQGGTRINVMTFSVTRTATTGLDNISSEQFNGQVYNILGQRTTKLGKGIFIINGKKVIRR